MCIRDRDHTTHDKVYQVMDITLSDFVDESKMSNNTDDDLNENVLVLDK